MMRFFKVYFTGIIILAAFLCFCGQSAAFTTHNTTLSRSFDKLEEITGGTIRVTVSFANLETASLRGFFYSDHIPQGLTVNTESVVLNGSPVNGYTYETGVAGDVWAGSITHRWTLETPADFSENNPVQSGASVQIVYLLTSSRRGTFQLKEFNWAGYFQNASDAAFGHSESSDARTVEFQGENGIMLPGVLPLLLLE